MGDFRTDQILAIAKSIRPDLPGLLLGLEEPQVGIPWAGARPIHSAPFAGAVLVLSLLLDPEVTQAGSLEVFEVGGGYGILAWLASHVGVQANSPCFRTWTIFDLPHVTALQMWYLDRTLPHRYLLERVCGVSARSGSAAEWILPEAPRPPRSRVRLVDRNVRELWLTAHNLRAIRSSNRSGTRPRRVLVASWSWSEFAVGEFLWYFNHVLSLCDYAVYGYSPWWSQTDKKLELVLQQMEIVRDYTLANERLLLLRRRSVGA